MRRHFLRFALLLFLALRLEAADWKFSAGEVLRAPEGVEFTNRKTTSAHGTAELHSIRCDGKMYTLAVMDNPAGDFTLATAAAKRSAVAAVNGGYFHPDRTPLGLVIRQGREIHPFERAKLLSGLVTVSNGRVSLQRAGEFRATPAITEALQAGPFLIDRGRPVAGLNATRVAARTVVFTDDAGRFGLLVCRFTTLAETAEILASRDMLGRGKVIRALNLDGGSSTGLWVRGEPPFSIREGKEVRNYLAIVPRS